MLGLIGKKIGMTRVSSEGKIVACTIVKCDGNVVTLIKTVNKDGYDSVQLAYGDRKIKNTPNPLVGHFAKADIGPKMKVQEFINFQNQFSGKLLGLGLVVKLKDVFVEEEFVDVQANSKGKGFQGVMKRHGFGGVGDNTHGQHNRLRAPGAIGSGSDPSRVFKGLRMAGQMGNKKVTLKNLKILKIIPEQGIVVLKGSVPGPRYSYVTLKK